MNKVSTILLTADSPWQRALATRLASAAHVHLVGIVIQRSASRMKLSWIARSLARNPGSVWRRAALRFRFGIVMAEIAREERRRFGVEGSPRPWPAVPMLEVENINQPGVVDFVAGANPAVAAVSGTAIIKEPLISHRLPYGFLNLHTGLSPYYKGGPNCTLWALSRGEPEYVGATLHVLDPGIDTGAILLSEQTPMAADETLAGAVCATVELGHALYLRVLAALAEGRRPRPVPQDEVGTGRTFYTREWTAADLGRAVRFVEDGKLAAWVEAGRPGLDRPKTIDTLSEARP